MPFRESSAWLRGIPPVPDDEPDTVRSRPPHQPCGRRFYAVGRPVAKTGRNKGRGGRRGHSDSRPCRTSATGRRPRREASWVTFRHFRLSRGGHLAEGKYLFRSSSYHRAGPGRNVTFAVSAQVQIADKCFSNTKHLIDELGDLFGIDAAVGFIAGDDQNAIRAAAVLARQDSVGLVPGELGVPAPAITGYVQHAAVLPEEVLPRLGVLYGEVRVLG